MCCSRALHHHFELGICHAVAQYALEETAVGSLVLEKVDKLVLVMPPMRARICLASGPIGFTVSNISEALNAVSLRTVPPAMLAVVEGGLSPGTTVFATILNSASSVG